MQFPWFRMWNEFATDQKVQQLSEAMQRRLIMIFCFHSSGELKGFDEDILAHALRITREELAETKAIFIRRGFIAKDWTPKNWEKRQYRSDCSTERSRKSREKARNVAATLQQQSSNGVGTLSNVAATPSDYRGQRTETEKIDDFDHAHPGGTDPEGENKNGEQSLACIDALVMEIDQVWPDANWGASAYQFAKTYDPSSVVWGFHAAITYQNQGENMDMRRIAGLIKKAQNEGLKPGDGKRAEPRGVRTSRARPKTKTDELHESLDKRNAELKAKGILDEKGQLVEDDE